LELIEERHLSTSQQNSGDGNPERRRNGRFPFVAHAEISEIAVGTRIKARVNEISNYGCYLDMLNPFPVGTLVLVKIFTEADIFETSANVVYSHPNLGLGLAFADVSPQSLSTLQKWLMEAMRKQDYIAHKNL
jgi:PilZ domain